MRRMKVGFKQLLIVGFVVVFGAAAAQAIYLDESRNISLRMRLYSQASVRISNSQNDTTPRTRAGRHPGRATRG